ncbi:ATPase components of various ABC-type transport systems, contain duplicated ATPase [Butyrivibrio fibrisolvens 16/4]|nr:ATPase components of various ABC-type transport systems, contain duplicated ATPase [Butyrivibrio fibrisolvens 16/4]
MSQEILKYDSVEISFEKCPVVQDISFSLHEGEILALVGESGSGKSSLIRSALGILNDDGKVTKGEILYRGTNLLQLKEREMRQIRGAKIGMIFQDAKSSLCPIRTIGDQILESLSAHGKTNKAEAKKNPWSFLISLVLRMEKKFGIAIHLNYQGV